MSGKSSIFLVLCAASVVLAEETPNGENDTTSRIKLLDKDISEDSVLDVDGLLTKYRYPSETHNAVTEDGYILTMHRITGAQEEFVTQNFLSKKPVILLMHGFLGSSADWVVTGTKEAFGYQLADEGFDVWMGNARGNYYSRNHKSLDPNESEFWKFSWDEIGYYDLPAMIDKILNVTGKTKIHYAGHSQGTTTFFVMASRRPKYNDKIKSMQALSPVVYMSNLNSPILRMVAPHTQTIELLISVIGLREFLPHSVVMTNVAKIFCSADSYKDFCTNIMFAFSGYDKELLNATLLPVLLGHFPEGSSTGQLIHYAQGFKSGKFKRYDHGSVNNLLKYGSLTPPDYDLSLVTSPVFLHYSDNDWIASVKDVTQLYTELGNAVGMFRVPFDKFNHVDFIWAMHIRPLLYNRVIQYMRAYE